MKAWGGRFEQEMTDEVLEFNQSIDVDEALLMQDIEGSIAHVSMLSACDIITPSEAEEIIQGLQSIRDDYQQGAVIFSKAHEDIHLNIEKELTKRIGKVAGKMHTARSRNDQVATDMHLYAKEAALKLIDEIKVFQQVIINKAKKHIDIIMPGYTHLQRAQPVLFSHHIMTYFWMLERDKERLQDSLKRIDVSPLGSGALAGTTFPIDQEKTQEILDFSSVYMNSMDAVSDRDYLLETMNNLNLIMMHLSRFSEEIILWATTEFNFVTLSDVYSTGSSIMPQKKNPDMAELIRGKCGTVTGSYIALLMTLKGLPLAYNKDLQEDKKGFFDAIKQTTDSVKIFTGMVQTMTMNNDRLEEAVTSDFSNATELADYLAEKGIPFREAHEITGKLVLFAIKNNKLLQDISLEEYQSASSLIEEDIYQILMPKAAVERRQNMNGTSTASVQKQITYAESLLKTH